MRKLLFDNTGKNSTGMQTMNTLELSGLEYQVDHLLRRLDRLKVENNTLRQQLATKARERTHLLEKNHSISERIKKIIAQLKEEMQ